jgi:magnesium transporter
MNEIKTTPKAVPEQVFFLSEILGSRVYLGKKKFGRLTDLVIKENGALPVVTQLFISRPFGETNLIPWDAVKVISPRTIEIEVDNIEKLPKEPGEDAILLKDHILDKKALDLEGREVEVVYDIKLALRNKKLYVSDVDLSRNGLLRRMGLKSLANFIYKLADTIQEQTISWTYIEPLPTKMSRFRGDVQLKVLKEALSDMHPVDVADILEELDHEQRVRIFAELEPEQASDTLEEVDPNVQRDLVSSIRVEKAAQLINEMTPAQAADVLAVLPASDAREIINLLDDENKRKVQPILEQQDENILNIATLGFIKFPPEKTVEQAQDEYRFAAKGKDEVMYLYIVDNQDHLLGVVDIKELLQSDDQAKLKEIMVDNVISLSPENTLREAADMFKRYSFRVIPVTDEENHILGVVTYRDVINLNHRFVE